MGTGSAGAGTLPLADRPIHEVAALLERGEVSSRDLVEACLARIERDGERLNTFTTDLMDWGRVFHVNFFAPVVLARGLREELAAAKGAVVNVTSIAGTKVHPFAGAAYATSKAALKEVETLLADSMLGVGRSIQDDLGCAQKPPR